MLVVDDTGVTSSRKLFPVNEARDEQATQSAGNAQVQDEGAPSCALAT